MTTRIYATDTIAFEWDDLARIAADDVFAEADRRHGKAPTRGITKSGARYYTHGRYDPRSGALVRIVAGNATETVVADRLP